MSATVNSILSVQHELDKVLVSDSDLSVWTNITQDKKRYGSDDFRAYQQKYEFYAKIGVKKKKLRMDGIGGYFSHMVVLIIPLMSRSPIRWISRWYQRFTQYQWHDWQLGINAGYGVSSVKFSGEQKPKNSSSCDEFMVLMRTISSV